MFSRMQTPLRTRLINSKPFRLSVAAGSGAVIFCAIYFGGRLNRAAPSMTNQQAIDLVRNVRFGKNSVDQEVYWLCHLLDGKSSGKTPFPRHKCQWQAARISPSLWRVEYEDRGVALNGIPTATDKVWLLDTATMEIQPRTITTLMITAPELVGVTSRKELDERLEALTGRPFVGRSATMTQEVDTLPRWRVDRNGFLNGRSTSAGGEGRVGNPLQAYPKLLNRDEALANLRRYYPPAERSARREADVEVVLHIGPDGSVGVVDILKTTNRAFDAAAQTVGKTMRFSPALNRSGKPFAVRLPQPMQFRLKN
ncbi:MAG: TonB family protein [Elusimicrobiota bacterium]